MSGITTNLNIWVVSSLHIFSYIIIVCSFVKKNIHARMKWENNAKHDRPDRERAILASPS